MATAEVRKDVPNHLTDSLQNRQGSKPYREGRGTRQPLLCVRTKGRKWSVPAIFPAGSWLSRGRDAPPGSCPQGEQGSGLGERSPCAHLHPPHPSDLALHNCLLTSDLTVHVETMGLPTATTRGGLPSSGAGANRMA